MAGKKLVIVESPNKCDTIKGILGSDYVVMASKGHITEIKDGGSYWNTGIDPKNNFKISYGITPAQKKRVEELKKAVESAEMVYLATDPDREGEDISWHLKKQLKIPESKYQRITFHEITKSAILKALSESRKINEHLFKACEARKVADKICGFRLTPIVRRQIQAKSIGRCQGAALKIIVKREDEIVNFKPEKYFDLYVYFKKNSKDFKAKYIGTPTQEIKKITDPAIIKKVKEDCEGKDYFIDSIEKKELKENPKPPFTTSTFQQEANRVYGMSTDNAMNCAQKLFEGISIMGNHVALITYIRTDDCSMAPEFQENLKDFILTNYGKKYLGKLQQGKKSENSQEAHECLRVINLAMTPEELAKYISDTYLLKVYKLIYLRTLQCMMSAATISDTQYNIKNGDHGFVMHSKEIIFDGYRKIYTDEDSSASEVIKETFAEKEILQDPKLQEEAKETTPPNRYTEATFIKELDKTGVGRPSTYSKLIKTILSEDRGYCTTEKKTIIPTTKGIELSHYLDEHFPDIMSINYTCEMEKELDLIANNKLDDLTFLNTFYNNLEESAKKVVFVKAKAEKTDKVCPKCGKPLVIRHGPKGDFLGCSGWRPNNKGCNYIEKI